jgi:hypothetical protein
MFPLSCSTYCFGMINTVRSPHGRPFSKRRLLLPLVGILAAAVVVTAMQVRPQAHAAAVNDVQVTEHGAEASLKDGPTATCVIRSRSTFQGEENRVSDFVESASRSARDLGMKVETGAGAPAPGRVSTDLILSYEFELTRYAIAPENCSTEKAIDAHRGRKAIELPSWARGMVAALTAIIVYLAVVFSVTALFAFVAPEFMIWGEIIGGCIGGFASSFVSNFINGVPQAANLTSSTVQCVAGAVLNVTIGTLKQQMIESVRGHLVDAISRVGSIRVDSLSRVVSMAISRGSGRPAEVVESFRTAGSVLSEALGEVH